MLNNNYNFVVLEGPQSYNTTTGVLVCVDVAQMRINSRGQNEC